MYIYIGYSIGSVLAFAVTGALCDALGWESTFYIPCKYYSSVAGAKGSSMR